MVYCSRAPATPAGNDAYFVATVIYLDNSWARGHADHLIGASACCGNGPNAT